MTNAQLEHVVMVQARELEAQRAQIDALILERDRLADRIEHQRTEWRRGYQSGWSAARRNHECEVCAGGGRA